MTRIIIDLDEMRLSLIQEEERQGKIMQSTMPVEFDACTIIEDGESRVLRREI